MIGHGCFLMWKSLPIFCQVAVVLIDIKHPRVLCNSNKYCLKLEISQNNYPEIMKIHQGKMWEFIFLKCWELLGEGLVIRTSDRYECVYFGSTRQHIAVILHCPRSSEQESWSRLLQQEGHKETRAEARHIHDASDS